MQTDSDWQLICVHFEDSSYSQTCTSQSEFAKILWKEAATNQVTGAIEGGSQILKALNAQPLSHQFFITTAEVVKNFNAITEEPQVSFLD